MQALFNVERVMGFEPTNGSLGSYCLTTWLHPQLSEVNFNRIAGFWQPWVKVLLVRKEEDIELNL
jgi:hypothetical protein